MLKIGIITFHRAMNYGSCLQAYATAAFLNGRGYQAEIIDYTNRYEQRTKGCSHKENGKHTGHFSALLRNTLLGKRDDKISFGEIEKFYPLTAKRYKSKITLEELTYDVLVAGSDRIWDPSMTDGLDEAFLLQFGKAARRISIASSLGNTRPDTSSELLFVKAFQTFSEISVRENFARRLLQPISNKPIKVLMDPVFLLNKQEWWEQLGKKSRYHSVDKPYILTYFISENAQKYRVSAENIANMQKLPVREISCCTDSQKGAFGKISVTDLEDFIALIANAELVLTDSFYGIAFSINFEKDFISFGHDAESVCVMELLENFGLKDRLDMTESQYQKINYDEVRPKLERLRFSLRSWVLNAIEGK